MLETELLKIIVEFISKFPDQWLMILIDDPKITKLQIQIVLNKLCFLAVSYYRLSWSFLNCPANDKSIGLPCLFLGYPCPKSYILLCHHSELSYPGRTLFYQEKPLCKCWELQLKASFL